MASTALLVLLLACPTLADMGDYTKGLRGSSVSLAEAVLIMGVTLAVLSMLVLIAGFLELAGTAFSYSIAHIVLGTLWLPVVGISIFLTTHKHYPAVAFVSAGAVFVVLHTIMAVRQLCLCCCTASFMGTSTENPKSALLKSPGGGDNGQQGRADSPTGSDPRPAACDRFNPVAGVGGGGALEGRNPFHATYGLLPGSSVFAYQIFIPGNEEQQAGSWGPQSSARQDSPNSEGRLAKCTQPLVQLQPSSARPRQ